jgi:ABC-2 type transport system permease protein
MAALMLLPAWLGKRAADDKVVVEAVDRSGRGLTTAINAAVPMFGGKLELREVPPTTSEAELLERIRSRAIQGYLVIPPDVLDAGEVVYRGDNATSFAFQIRLNQLLNAAVMGERARRAGLDAGQVVSLLRPVEVDAKQTTGEGKAKSATESYLVGIAVMLILYMAILLYAVNVMRSVVQEKTSRVIEIVVSATKPRSLMLGKVIGVGCVGLLQLSIWAGVGLLLIALRGQILGAFGVSGAEGFAMPPLAVGDAALSLLYFLLGYFFYSSLYAAIGAMVSSDQEAQQAQTPVVLLLIIPVACVQLVANDPRGGAAQLLTMIPFSSPVLMPMRYLLGGATPAEVALSLGILALSMAGAVVLAARIYRVGILMVGKRPTLRELARWIRYS